LDPKTRELVPNALKSLSASEVSLCNLY